MTTQQTIRISVLTFFGLTILALGEQSIVQNGDFEEGLKNWTPRWQSEEFFTAKTNDTAFVRYTRSAGQATNTSATLWQTVQLKPDQFYDLTIDYQTDETLAPVIWIVDTTPKKKPSRMIRLPNSPERSTFRSRLNIGSVKGPVTLHICPGTLQKNFLQNKLPSSTQPGTVDVYSLSITPSSFREPEVTRTKGGFRTEEVIYKTVGNLKLSLFLDIPENPPAGKMPVAFWVHGGGWVTGSPKDVTWRTSQIAPRGILNARVQYRLIKQGGTFPKTFQDLLDAMQWLRDHADEYNIDMSRLVIGGGSAGGQLSSVLAQKTPECIGYIGMCGLYNTVEIGDSRFGHAPKFLPNADVIRSASAIHNIRENPPATLLIHGEADATIDSKQALYFADALRKNGGQVETLILEGTGHGFGYPYAVNQSIDKLLASLGFPEEQKR